MNSNSKLMSSSRYNPIYVNSYVILTLYYHTNILIIPLKYYTDENIRKLENAKKEISSM